MGIHRRDTSETVTDLFTALRFLSLVLAVVLICGYFSDDASATTRRTVTMPSNPSVMSNGTSTLAPNGVLQVMELAPGIEYIPNGASESRALASIGKGVRIPTSGITSALKSGLKANVPALLASGVVAGIVAGVDWIQGEGGVIQKAGTVGGPVATSPGQYRWGDGSGSYEYSTAAEGCKASTARSFGTAGTTTLGPITNNGSVAQCIFGQNGYEYYTSSYRDGSGCPAKSSYSTTVGACVSASTDPAPLVESDYSVLDGFVQGKDGVWQRGLADEVCKSSTNYNSCIAQMGGEPYLTGPASVTTPSTQTTTTTQNPDGTSTEVTTDTKTKYDLGYGTTPAPYVDMTPTATTTTTTTTKDATGTVTSTSTSTSTTTSPASTSPTPEVEYDYADSPFPEVPSFYTQKFPGGFAEVWQKNKESFDSSPFVGFLNSFVPSFSGSCPSWAMSFDIMPHANFGSRSFNPLCYIFDIVKVIMLVTAMFTCRAIIFGG